MKFYAIPLMMVLMAGCAPERGPVVDFKASPIKPAGDVTFSKEYAGKPALIYVWATWCGPCRELAPKIAELKDKYASKGIAFIALAQDKAADVRAFEKTSPHPMDVFIDSSFTFSQAVDTSSIPVVAVVDADHRTVVVERGSSGDTIASLELALEAVAKK